MSLRRVNPGSLQKPQGFSHAIVADGLVVCLAGQTGTDASGRIMPGGLVAQFEHALGNLLTALREAGGAPDQLAAVTIYACDIEDYKSHARRLGEVWRRLVGSEYPAMAAVEISRLWDIEALIEIQGLAVLDRRAEA